MSIYFGHRRPPRRRLMVFCLVVIANQAACIPTDAQSWSDLASEIATDVLNQGIEFALSFIRSGLAAFVL